MMTKKEKEKIEAMYSEQSTRYDEIIKYLIKLIPAHEVVLNTWREELDYWKELAHKDKLKRMKK